MPSFHVCTFLFIAQRNRLIHFWLATYRAAIRMQAYEKPKEDPNCTSPVKKVESMPGYYRCCMYKWNKARRNEQWTSFARLVQRLLEPTRSFPTSCGSFWVSPWSLLLESPRTPQMRTAQLSSRRLLKIWFQSVWLLGVGYLCQILFVTATYILGYWFANKYRYICVCVCMCGWYVCVSSHVYTYLIYI